MSQSQTLRHFYFPKTKKLTFVHIGFMNRVKGLEKFHEHKNSAMQKESILKLAAKSSSKRIGDQLLAQLRQMSVKLLCCIRYLSSQGLEFHGLNEYMSSFEGNLNQLLLFQAQDFSKMSLFIHKREYISPKVMIKIMGQSVLPKMLANIRQLHGFQFLLMMPQTYHTVNICHYLFDGLIRSLQFVKIELA